MELRLYEKDERDEIRTRIRARKLQYDRSDEQADWGSCKRVRRFFGSIKGFHQVRNKYRFKTRAIATECHLCLQGSLDLTGRHEYRFRDLSEKWARMAPELLKIKQHTLIVETPVFGGDEEPIIDLDGTPWTTRECVVTPPELYDCFALTWRVRGTNLEYIFDSASKYHKSFPILCGLICTCYFSRTPSMCFGESLTCVSEAPLTRSTDRASLPNYGSCGATCGKTVRIYVQIFP